MSHPRSLGITRKAHTAVHTYAWKNPGFNKNLRRRTAVNVLLERRTIRFERRYAWAMQKFEPELRLKNVEHETIWSKVLSVNAFVWARVF